MEKIRVFTAFSGYDSQCLSLDRLKKKYPEFDYELVGWSEINKYAIQAHNAIYPQWADRNYGDISKINWDVVPDFDLFTYSSPCQDFSNAGLQRGGEEGSGTRSSLLWECRRVIVAKKPKFLLMENVAALVSQKFLPLFNKWQAELARYGYSNFAQVLNAKDYGIPKNRERIFLVSVLGEAWYNFPQPFKLEKRLKDVLETNVDEKYYLSEKTIAMFANTLTTSYNQDVVVSEPKAVSYTRDSKGKTQNKHLNEIVNTIHSSTGSSGNTDCFVAEPKVQQIGNIYPDKEGFKNRTAGRIFSADGLSPTLRTMSGGHQEPKIKFCYRIRKLTPRECFRLMDVDENVIDTIQAAGISNSQQYKLAGNSIVVACLEKIFEQMFFPQYTNSRTLFG